jgi:fucose 4-O-acetylase-like acetyltransferase
MGVLVTVAAPIFSEMPFTGVPEIIRLYLKPDYAQFSFFPWASFMAFGVCFGSILRIVGADHAERLMQWTALAGFGLLVAGSFFGNNDMSLYSKSEYWLDSPTLVFTKLGMVLLLLAVAYVWTEYGLHGRRSWVALFGTHSLFIYWVHVELVYGQLLQKWKETLGIGPTALAAVATIVLMGALTLGKRRLLPQGLSLRTSRA